MQLISYAKNYHKMDKIDRLLNAIEHPESYSPTEIEEMLRDREVKEVYDLLDKTKSSLQILPTPDIDAEWKRFERNHAKPKVRPHSWFTGIMSRKIVASATIIIVSISAVAAIVAIGVNHATQPQPSSLPAPEPAHYVEEIAAPDSIKQAQKDPAATAEIIVFDNEPLMTIADKIGAYYGYKVEFGNENAKSLRLYFRWNQEKEIEEVIERLDNFDRIHIRINDKTIIIF